MKLIVSTDNPHKLTEFQRILMPLGFDVCSKRDAGVLCSVPETGVTFAENAQRKAQAIFEQTGLPTVADDSGLEVDALDHAPGVYSARFGGTELTDQERCLFLLNKMRGVPHQKRGARFVCSICLILAKDDIRCYQASCAGRIGNRPIGMHGFGYDPIFMVEDGHSFAMLPDQQKDEMSHRGQALRMMQRDLEKG